jgi:hypothetical protein
MAVGLRGEPTCSCILFLFLPFEDYVPQKKQIYRRGISLPILRGT